MFGRKPKGVEAQAEILDAGRLVDAPKLVEGYAYGTFEHAVEVRPPGRPAQRAVARGLACTGCRPEPGDVVAVTWFPDGTATFDLRGDERYAPALVAQLHVDVAVAKDALYGQLEDAGARGVATVVAVRTGRHRFQNVEIRCDVRVAPKSGDGFDATLVEWVHESSPELIPSVGEKRKVLFDPGDRTKIAWR